MSPAPESQPSESRPSAAVPNFQPYSSDTTLTSAQHHVLSILAEGHPITYAAEKAGVHRNTVRNWRRTNLAFAREMEFAVREQALFWHEFSVQFASSASAVMEELLHSPATRPNLRFRVAQSILKSAADPAPKRLHTFPETAVAAIEAAGQQLVQQSKIENPAQSCTTAPLRKPPQPGRNALCTCGSGQKYKRCCGSPLSARAVG